MQVQAKGMALASDVVSLVAVVSLCCRMAMAAETDLAGVCARASKTTLDGAVSVLVACQSLGG